MNDLPQGFRTYPHNIEAEQALLGAILIRNEGFERLAGIVTADMFYEPVHRRIFESIKRMIEGGSLASHVTLKVAFDEDEALRELDGACYLSGLARAAETILNVKDYAHLIRDLACKRAIIVAAEDAANLAFDPSAPESASEIAGALNLKIEEIGAGSSSGMLTPVSQVLDELLGNLDAGVIPIKTGFVKLDNSMGGGMRPGSVYGIEAPAKSFKTGVVAGIFERSALDLGTPSLLVSLEMAPEDVLQRTMAGRAGIGFTSIEKAHKRAKKQADIDKLKELAELRGKTALTAHMPTVTIDRMLGVIAEAVVEHGIKLVLIDYWQLIGGKRRDQSTADHLEETAYRLMGFASKHKIAIVIASQTNREGKSLRSDGLRRACSWLGSLHKEEIPTACRTLSDTGIWIEVELNRYGPAHDIGTAFAPAFKIQAGPVLREWQ